MKKFLGVLISVLMLMQVVCIPAFAEDVKDVVFTISEATGKPGETISVTITVATNNDKIYDSVGLRDITYDTTALEFVGFADTEAALAKCIFGSFDDAVGAVALALKEKQALNGKVCQVEFKVLDTAAAGTYEIGATPIIKNGSEFLTAEVISGAVTVEVPPQATFTIGEATGNPGDTVSVPVSIATLEGVVYNTIGLRDFTYDATALEFVAFSDTEAILEKCTLGKFDNDLKTVVLGFSEEQSLSEEIFSIDFKIADDATEGTYEIGMTAIVKNTDDEKVTVVVEGAVVVEPPVPVEPPVVTISAIEGKPGDTVAVSLKIDAKNSEFDSLGFRDLEFNAEVLEFVGVEDDEAILEKSHFGAFDILDAENGYLAINLALKETFSGEVCKLIFKIKDDAPAGACDISITPVVKDGPNELGVSVEPATGTFAGIVVVPVGTDTDADGWDLWEYWAIQSIGASRFTIKATAGEGGSISFEGTKTVLRNASLTYVITPDEGFEVASVLVDGKDVGAVTSYTFKKVTAKHTIAATFKPVEALPFTDVAADADYFDAIKFVYLNDPQLMNGTSETTFEPDATMTRGMFATVLSRLAVVDVAEYTTPTFSDVVAGEWYAAAVEWAAANGIVLGYGDGTFGVEDEITVEQAVVILARYAKLAGVYADSDIDLSVFDDGADVSEWAVAEMKWAVANGIYAAVDNKLAPTEPASRALLATMMFNYVNAFAK